MKNHLKFYDNQGSFSVTRIICIGRNYTEHAIEMGHGNDKEKPFFFFKPITSLFTEGGKLTLPAWTNNVHHEVELVIAVGKAGAALEPSTALNHVHGVGIGLDLTERDIQAEAKKKGRPWSLSKGFDRAAPCSKLVSNFATLLAGQPTIQLIKNHSIVQRDSISQMIWPIDQLISYLSQYIVLQPGDLIFTGTPAGVGPVNPDDTLTASIEGTEVQLHVEISRDC